MCAQYHLKVIFAKYDVDCNEHLNMLKDGMASSILCFFHFERIETICQLLELIDPSYGNKIEKNQEQFSQLDVANEKEIRCMEILA